jgi:hypothetical protein
LPRQALYQLPAVIAGVKSADTVKHFSSTLQNALAKERHFALLQGQKLNSEGKQDEALKLYKQALDICITSD